MTDHHRTILAQAARNAQDAANVLHDWSRRKGKPGRDDAEKLNVVLRSVSAAVDELANSTREPPRPNLCRTVVEAVGT